MNLQAIANAAIQAVNPNQPAMLVQSNGYTTNGDGSRSPSTTSTAISVQVQAMSGGDLRQTEGLNLSGVKRSMYLTGVAASTVRVTGQGGDLIVISSGVNAGTWLVNMVLEPWNGWTKVACTLQDGS